MAEFAPVDAAAYFLAGHADFARQQAAGVHASGAAAHAFAPANEAGCRLAALAFARKHFHREACLAAFAFRDESVVALGKGKRQ